MLKKSNLLSIIIFLIVLSFEFIKINETSLYNDFKKKYLKNEFYNKNNKKCNKFDPIYVMSQRFKKYPINICQNEDSQHICFQSSKYDLYNKLYRFPYGLICVMKNFVLDPSKSLYTNLTYKGPIDKIARGAPILLNGFFHINCEKKFNRKNYSKLYINYLNSWNYFDNEDNIDLEELAPEKTVFFISRNEDSPNLFHGFSEIINSLSVMYLLDLKPEEIQIIFLESIFLNNEPLLDIYTNLISRGNKPIYIRDLNKKYHISSAIHIPIGADSPLFMMVNNLNCKYSTITYSIVNKLINKYLNITKYKESFKSDNETFYYPNSIIKNKILNITFKKKITIQWRKVWPKGRMKQKRLLGNGPELSEKLSDILPSNFLIKLVDTASLPIDQQISIIKDTDYFIGVHGAGLALSIFMPNTSILHEILPYKKNKLLSLMSKLSGHRTYSDVIKNKIKIIEQNEYIFFEENDFSKFVIKHMRQNNII